VFQKRTPGGSFVADEMLAFESHGIVKWRLLDAQGKPGAFDMYGFDYGYDVVEFNAEGRIERILMFVHMKGASLEIARPLADSDDTVRDDCPCTVPELDHACLRTFEILEPVTTGGRLESALPHTTPSFPIARPFRLGCADRGRARRR
jgi:hypothetical protein